MISEEEARKKILETVRSLPSRRLSLSQALGSFAAEDYFARLPLPGFDNSAMDGYAVVMQEDVTRDGDEIVINTDVKGGEFIRRRGCDVSEGQRILAKGERLRAATMALLASQGIDDLTVGGEVNA